MLFLSHHLEANAQYAPWASGQSRGEDLRIKLVTIGPGDELTMWWGHTALIVEDVRLHVEKFYNYGLFDFAEENFLVNFAMGRLIFWVDDFDASRALAFYRSLNREIRIQILNLPLQKRLEMAKLLAHDVMPENRYYLYDHFYDNCSTRIRDIIDRALDGQLAEDTRRPSRMTFRQHTRRYTHHRFFMDWFLMFLMNAGTDKPIREWDDMFLPEELERYAAELSYVDENGHERSLVADTYTYYRVEDKPSVPESPPIHWPFGLTIGVVFACLSFVIAYGMIKGKAISRGLFGIYNSVIGFAFGLPGSVLFFMSTFTDHTVTYCNENLLLANPLTLLTIPLGIGFARNRRLSRQLLPVVWYILTCSGALLVILKLFSVLKQNNWLAIAFILPVSAAFAISLFLLSKKQGQVSG